MVRELGRGGFGSVYLAEDATGARFALKVLDPVTGNDLHARTLFGRELEALRRVDSRHVAQLHEARLDSEPPWMALRIAGTRTLANAVAAGDFRVQDTLACLLGALKGLQAIHAVGMTHRDVSLDNMLVVPGDGVLLDLGLATLGHNSAHTRAMAGKLDYLAPEQWETVAPDPATDVWQWATAGVKSMAGHLPFPPTGSVVAQRRLLLETEPMLYGLHVHQLPRLLRRCLRIDPSDRPATSVAIAEMERVLEACRARQPDELLASGGEALIAVEAIRYTVGYRDGEISAIAGAARRFLAATTSGCSGARRVAEG